MKIARHSKIIELVDHYDIETQEEWHPGSMRQDFG